MGVTEEGISMSDESKNKAELPCKELSYLQCSNDLVFFMF